MNQNLNQDLVKRSIYSVSGSRCGNVVRSQWRETYGKQRRSQTTTTVSVYSGDNETSHIIENIVTKYVVICNISNI